MRRRIDITVPVHVAALLALSWTMAHAAGNAEALVPTTSAAQSIDLPTVLKLARANNLDVRLAQERLAEAQANHTVALEKFLPWVTLGAAYRRHEGRTQAVDGSLVDVDKQTSSIGPTITTQVDLGDAWFATLAAKQSITAATAASDVQQQDTQLNAAAGYFELLKAKMITGSLRDALATSQEYERQLEAGVRAGVVFKGDLLRVSTQTQHYQSAVLSAEQQQHIAASRLAELLHVDPALELDPQDAELVPLTLFKEVIPKEALTQQALRVRPEVLQSTAQFEAARANERGALYGPLIPTIGAQAFLGRVGGGRNDATGNYGGSRDYYVGLSWRIGPGGLFDIGRVRAARSRLTSAEIGIEKTRIAVERQVVDAWTRVDMTGKQLQATRGSLAAATETLRLTRDRKQLGVGLVLEDIQAQQELVRARSDFVTAIAEYNKAQYELMRVSGSP